MATSAIVPSLRSMMYAFSPEPPASSVAAFQDRSTCPQLATVAVRPVGGKGGMRSGVCAKLVPAEERRAATRKFSNIAAHATEKVRGLMKLTYEKARKLDRADGQFQPF